MFAYIINHELETFLLSQSLFSYFSRKISFFLKEFSDANNENSQDNINNSIYIEIN